jgi:hypothetical protein
VTGLDELIRDVLSEEAEAQPEPTDLAARSMRQGRQIRRRRQVGFSAAAAASVVAIVGGSIAIADSVAGHPARTQTVISAAGQPGSGPWWQTWKTDRVYGAKPGAPFFATLARGDSVTYASGTTPDGSDFALYLDANDGEPHAANWSQGWNDAADFGTSSQKDAPDADYLAFESPTSETAGPDSDGAHTQWLIVAAAPGTTSASYSADGTTWTSMDVQDGIAVLKLPGIAPHSAHIRLTDASGQYEDGPLVTP